MSAVQEFNDLYGWSFADTVDEPVRQLMASFALLRGRRDLADRLIEEARENARPTLANAGGRWG